MKKFRIHKVWHLDIFDDDDVMIDSIMFHTKWEAEEQMKKMKQGDY